MRFALRSAKFCVCWVALLFSERLALAADPASAATPLKMNPGAVSTPRERMVLQSLLGKGPKPLAGDVVESGTDRYIVHLIEFRDAESAAAFKLDGVHVFDRFDCFANAFIPVNNDVDQRVAEIRKAPNWVWDEFAGQVFAPPPLIGSKTTSRGVPADIVRGGFGDRKGKGVLVVVIDTGLDFFNPDFITYDAQGVPTSRLRYFWDTVAESYSPGRFGQAAPVSYPNGSTVGVVYSHDDLNKAIRSVRPLVTAWDMDGHGTACASIAAGNGNSLAGKYPGVAPEADIIGIRLGDNLESAYLLTTICGWLDKIAGDTPMVISCSFGSSYTGHDGLTIEERQLNARFPADRKGRVVCVSAGNDGGNRMHAESDLAGKDKPAKFSWSLGGRSSLTVYFNSDDDKDLRYLDTQQRGLQESGALNPLSHTYVSQFQLPEGPGEIQFYTESGKAIHADAYLHSYSGQGDGFDDTCTQFTKLIETPGAATNVITVGSYDWNDQFDQHGFLQAFTDPIKGQPLTIGGLSIYSSTGPLRGSDVLKPEIAAPGQYYFAAASRNVRSTLDSTGSYRLFNGTSASAPYVAGIVALFMQKNHNLSSADIKMLMKQCATQDRFTGPLPNPRWGYGKLDVTAVEKIIQSLDERK
jgi:subtilisin family serine protease